MTPARKKLTLLFGILAIVALGFFGFEFWQWALPPSPLATGSFSVSSVPSGATVRWKGRELGLTPLRQYVLPLGDQVIELTTTGYQPCPIEFTVNAGLVADLGVRSLAKQLGKLRLVTEPSGVFYSVVGPDKKTIAGITPDTIENLPVGRYDVKLVQPGWPDYAQVADINSGEPVEVSRQFKGASVELTSDPPGATIFVGGAKLGTAPLSANLPLGPVEVTSRFGALGSVVQTLVPDPQRTVSFHFKHSYGTLLVSSDRADAVLIVDGLDFGHPPAQLFLAPGNHKLLLSAPSAPDKTRRVDLIEGQHINQEIDFGAANGEVAAVSNAGGSPTPTPTPSPTPPIRVASTSAPPASTPPNKVVSTSVTPASTPPPQQLAARTTPTPQPVSSPSPESNRISGSSPSPSPTLQKSVSGSEEQPVIPPANSEGTPLAALTPGPESPKPGHPLHRSPTLAKKENAAATPSLDPEQAKNKAEAHQLLNAQSKANDEALRTEKRYIDYQIKNSSGAVREQWKYQLVQWRLKKTRAKQDRAAEEARLKEEWRR